MCYKFCGWDEASGTCDNKEHEILGQSASKLATRVKVIGPAFAFDDEVETDTKYSFFNDGGEAERIAVEIVTPIKEKLKIKVIGFGHVKKKGKPGGKKSKKGRLQNKLSLQLGLPKQASNAHVWVAGGMVCFMVVAAILALGLRKVTPSQGAMPTPNDEEGAQGLQYSMPEHECEGKAEVSSSTPLLPKNRTFTMYS